MPSTYIDYRVYTRDLARTLKVTAAEPQVAREAEYYKANIGKVKSVDEFLKNDRLYNYAMRANGLTDRISSKAFMRKVLESDLDDSRSFARSLVDTRYQTFARAFNFGTDGKVAASTTIAQTDAQENDTVGLYSEYRVRRGETAAAEVANYQDRIGLMPNVNGFLRDERLVSFALTSNGIEPKFVSMDTLKSVLTSDLSDPESFANKLGATGPTGAAFLELAKAFGFGTDGSVPAGGSPQTDAQMKDMIYRYYDKTGNLTSPAAAAFKSDVYSSAISAVTSVDDILADSKLFDYVVTAFGLDSTTTSASAVRDILTSDLSDPESFANKQTDSRARTMAAAFNFNTDGTVKGTEGAQTPDQVESTVNAYFTYYDDKAEKTESLDTSYFKSTVTSTTGDKTSTITKVDDIINNSRLYNYLLKSYDLDPTTESKVMIRKVLLSDVSDPKSFANTLTDTRYRKLAAAVNFGADGTVTTARGIQGESDELATVKLYNSRIPATATDLEKTRAKDEGTYYHGKINTYGNVNELLADKRTVTYILKAYGLEGENLPNNILRQVLTSDPQDPKSFANKMNDSRYRDLAAAFSFKADGSISRLPANEAQSRSNAIKTSDLYLYQQMETEAGNQSDGIRLALYFRRKAPNIGTAFDILADKALFEVARTALGLPASMSQMDIDAQAKLLTKRLTFADFKDPTKLDQFIARFATQYDQANNANLSTSPASIILGSSSSDDPNATFTPVSFDASLLASMQGVKFGR